MQASHSQKTYQAKQPESAVLLLQNFADTDCFAFFHLFSTLFLQNVLYCPHRSFYKGVHTAMLKSYIAFDLETTGLDPQENEIIEIGALKVREEK